MNRNSQKKITFTTKNYKGKRLLGTSRMGRIQSKLADRQKNIPIIQMSINIALHNMLDSCIHLDYQSISKWWEEGFVCSHPGAETEADQNLEVNLGSQSKMIFQGIPYLVTMV